MIGNNQDDVLARALTPASVAIIGASDNPDKVGGRPIDYLQRFGYSGKIFPVNPSRQVVQGITCYPTVNVLPEVPDLAIIAVGSGLVREVVIACAAKKIPAAIILSSGFGEAGEQGLNQQKALVEDAAAAGMRIIGPNAQGLANFSIGAVCNFSTMFTQVSPKDGPVAVVSQSGATGAVLYTLLRERDVGVRYVLATGNEADVTVADLALRVAKDPAIRLIILYMESISDAVSLRKVLSFTHQIKTPVIVLKAGRTPSGAAAAQSHTGALVNEDAIVEEFFSTYAAWRASGLREIADAAPLYLKRASHQPHNGGLVVISNSGSSCVMCADSAEEMGLPLAHLNEDTRLHISKELAAFASVSNPIDLTAGLMSDSTLLGAVLTHLKEDPAVSTVLISLPVAGNGYDLDYIAKDIAEFEQVSGKTVVVSSTLESALEPFRTQGLITFAGESAAIRALAQYTHHSGRLEKVLPGNFSVNPVQIPAGNVKFLNESASLACIQQAGIPCAPYEHCDTLERAIGAWRRLGSTVVLKACSEYLPHKSEHNLVFLGLNDENAVRVAFESCNDRISVLGLPWEGVVVAKQVSGRRELAVGAKIDPVFGPVVMVGDGGKYIEAMPDFSVLIPPFDAAIVKKALSKLRIAPLLQGVRGEAPMDQAALCDLILRLGALVEAHSNDIASIDLNPVMVKSDGEGVWVVDALIERRTPLVPTASLIKVLEEH